jgi:hypothetical protein
LNFSLDPNGKITIKQTNIIIEKSDDKILEIQELESIISTLDLEKFYQPKLKNSSFYFDYQRGTIFITNNKESILSNINSIAQKIILDKFQKQAKEEHISYFLTEKENNETEIMSMVYKDEYGVIIRVRLLDIANILLKIDF